MLTLLSLSVVCVVAVVAISLILAVVGLPLIILFALLPWMLRLAGVVLLVKALLDKPLRWESFVPAAAAFVVAWLL